MTRTITELRILLAETLFYWAIKASPLKSDCRYRLCAAFLRYSGWPIENQENLRSDDEWSH